MTNSTLNQIIENQPTDNVTDWQKENGTAHLQNAQATLLNALCSGLHFSIKSNANYLDSQVLGLVDHISSAYRGSDSHNYQTECRTATIKNIELNIEGLTEALDACKSLYKKSTGEVFKPYVKTEKRDTAKTASNLLAMDIINKAGKSTDKLNSIFGIVEKPQPEDEFFIA